MSNEEIKLEGSEDYSLERVPLDQRYHWWTVTMMRFGQVSALSQFLLGAALGFGMTFWGAFLAILLGSVILELVSILTGLIGQKEGLSTSVLARWTGFGRYGSSIIGFLIALSLIGWFGVQCAVAAHGIALVFPAIPEWVWTLIIGFGLTAIVLYGFKSMAWTAYITIPAFLLLLGWSVITELIQHNISTLLHQAPPGPVLDLRTGATIAAGAFMVGAIITPDMTRFNRTPADVVKQTIIGITLGEFLIGLAGVLLAHALKTSDIIAIVTSSSGLVGIIIIVAGTLKINDFNLYSSTLGIVNFIQTIFNKRVSRVAVTVFVGVIGSILGALGIFSYFKFFLVVLGDIFPPIAGIMIAEYYIVRIWRNDVSHSAPSLPESEPTWILGTFVAWAVAILFAVYFPWGIASLNSLIASIILYTILGKINLIRAISSS